MYERLKNLYDYEILKDKNILLVGVGGVGSAAFEVLIRSGIQNITIVDFDVYEKSNLNRQLCSNEENIGKKKIDVLFNHVQKINDEINITIIDEFLNENSNINFSNFDFIIDACDSVPAKKMLIKNASKFNIPIIISMGVGNRLNPLNLNYYNLNDIIHDPLAKKLRNELKKDNFNVSNIKCVASNEKPIKSNPISSYIGVSMNAGILLADYVIKCLLEM